MGISSTTGLISGLETESIITAMMNLEKAPITKLQQKQAVFQTKISSYGMLKSSLSSLQSSVSAFKSPDAFAAGYSSSSSNKDIVGVSISNATTVSEGNYRIKVSQLATSAQMTSYSYTENDSAVGTGALQFKIGDGEKKSISINTENQSLEDIAQAINDGDTGISASVLRVADNDYRLTLTANDTGKDISYSYQETGFTFATSVQANASNGETMKSQEFNNDSTALGITGTLSINGTDISLTGTESLNDIQASVDALSGISATVNLDNRTGKYSLSVTNETAKGEVKLSYKDTNDAAGFSHLMDPASTVASKKALVNINNIDVQRDSNSITDLIQGVTLNLVSEDTEKIVNVSVTANHNSAKTKLDSFVESFNNVMKSLNSLQSYDKSSGNAGNLLGDSTANLLRSGMRRMIFSSVSGISSDVNSLSSMGIEVEATGLLSFDSSKFTSAMKNNPEDVTKFFTANDTGAKGIAVQFDSFLTGYLDSKKGILAAKIDGYTASSSQLDKNIEAINTRLTKREDTLRKQFNSLEQLLSTMSSTSSYLATQLSALSNMTGRS